MEYENKLTKKTVIRAIVQYSWHDDHYAMRLYYSDQSTELFILADGVRSQLQTDGVPSDHSDWLDEFKRTKAE